MPKQTYSIELEERQYQFLEKMVNDHGLHDVSKAVRILVDYMVETPDQHETIFDTIRCLDC